MEKKKKMMVVVMVSVECAWSAGMLHLGSAVEIHVYMY